MKVKHLAKELGKPVKEFIGFLYEFDIRVKSGSTKLDDETVQNVRDLFKGERSSLEEESFAGKTVPFELDSISVNEFSSRFHIPVSEVLKVLLSKGLLFNLNSELDAHLAAEIAMEFDIALDIPAKKGKSGQGELRSRLEKIEENELDQSLDHLEDRPPVIAVMGHVDHGKTLILDVIRKSKVIAGEAGGITQHIGAYQVDYKGKKMTFLDTPGHAAFTALRSRGAQVTDIAILVVAADDGVKPQTIEAIDHAKAAQVPIVVAINKMDKPGADPDRIKQQLAEHDILSEDWGGNTVMVPISAKKEEGITDLLDMIQLTSDVLELKAAQNVPAKGVVIESHLSNKLGAVATVLVKTGTLSVGDNFVIGTTMGKVRAMLNDRQDKVKQALPGTPVELIGISEVPSPGDILEVYGTDRECRDVVEERLLEASESGSRTLNSVSLESLSQQIESGDVRKLNLIVKADVHGSLEAILHSISDIPSEDVSINIIHSGTGPVNESDVMLAKASEAFVVGFNVDSNPAARQLAEKEGVRVRAYTVIYEIVDDLTNAVKGLFKIEYEEVELGRAEVRQLFSFSKVGTIAGCSVKSGVIKHRTKARVIRKGDTIFDGDMHSLKRFKDDVKEVKEGFECGIVLDGFDDFEENDLIIVYKVQEVKR